MSWLSAIVGVSVGGMIIFLMQRDRLIVRHGLIWFLFSVSLILLGLFPTAIDILAGLFGIGYPPMLAIAIVLPLVILKVFLSDLALSKSEVRVARLVQRLAMVEADLKDLENRRAPSNDAKSADKSA